MSEHTDMLIDTILDISRNGSYQVRGIAGELEILGKRKSSATELAMIIHKQEAELARLTTLVNRLKEDGERFAKFTVDQPYYREWVCHYCHHYSTGDTDEIKHDENCLVTLHRQLMAEIEREG